MPRKLTALNFADALKSPNVTTRVLGGATHASVGWAIGWARGKIRDLSRQLRASTIQREKDKEGTASAPDHVVFDRRYYYEVNGKGVKSVELFLNAYTALWTVTIRADAVGRLEPIMWGGDHNEEIYQFIREVDFLNVGDAVKGGINGEEPAGFGIGALRTITISDDGDPITPVRLPALGTGLTYDLQRITKNNAITTDGLGSHRILDHSWIKTLHERAIEVDQYFLPLHSFEIDCIFETTPAMQALGASTYMQAYLEPIYWDQENDLITSFLVPDEDGYRDGYFWSNSVGFLSDPLSPTDPSLGVDGTLSQRKGSAMQHMALTVPRSAMIDAATQNQDLVTQRDEADISGEIPAAEEWPRYRHIIESRAGLEPGSVQVFEWNGFSLSYVPLPTTLGEFKINSGDFGENAVTVFGNVALALNGIATGTITQDPDTFELIVSSVSFYLSVAIRPIEGVQPRQGALDLISVVNDPDSSYQPIWTDMREVMSSATGIPITQLGADNERQDFATQRHPGALLERIAGDSPISATSIVSDPGYRFFSYAVANHPTLASIEFDAFLDISTALSTEGPGGRRTFRISMAYMFPNIIGPVHFVFEERQEETALIEGKRYEDAGHTQLPVSIGVQHRATVFHRSRRVHRIVTFSNGVPTITSAGINDYTIDSTKDTSVGPAQFSYTTTGFTQSNVFAIRNVPEVVVGSANYQAQSYSGDLSAAPPYPKIPTLSEFPGAVDIVQNTQLGFRAVTTVDDDLVFETKWYYNGTLISTQPSSGNIDIPVWAHDLEDLHGDGEQHDWPGLQNFVDRREPVLERHGTDVHNSLGGITIRASRQHEIEVVTGGGLMLAVYWPNAIPADPDNPGLFRDGVLLAEITVDRFSAHIAYRDIASSGTPAQIQAARNAVLATMNVIINNFASDDFLAGISTQQAKSYMILQPR